MATPVSTPTTRRERRAAARAAGVEHDVRRSRGRVAPRRPVPSFALITIAAVALGLGLVVFTALSGPGRIDTTDLRSPSGSYPASLADGRSLGDPAAPVTLVVWSDFQCPVCARYATTVEPLLVSRYVEPGILRIEHRDATILGRGGSADESVLAAVAARGAAAQGAYWPYHDWLFANQDGENRGGFATDRLVRLAAAAELDLAAFELSLADPALREAVLADTREASDAGIHSTPTLVIAGQAIVGLRGIDELGPIIEAAARDAGATLPAGG